MPFNEHEMGVFGVFNTTQRSVVSIFYNKVLNLIGGGASAEVCGALMSALLTYSTVSDSNGMLGTKPGDSWDDSSRHHGVTPERSSIKDLRH